MKNNYKLKYNFNITITYFENLASANQPEIMPIDWERFISIIEHPKHGSKQSNGCFVGGYVEGHRKNENVKSRSMLTIDIDDIPSDLGDFYGHIADRFKGAYAIYSTHNHTEDNPRYRLVIPFSEPLALDKDEYRTLIKEFSNVLEIPFYDKASEVLCQVMHLPTIEADRRDEYVFKFQDGQPLQSEVIKELLKSIQVNYYNGKRVYTDEERSNYTNETIEVLEHGASQGERNIRLAQLTGRYLNKGLHHLEIINLLQLWNEHKNNPPLSEMEFINTVGSIFNINNRDKGGANE